MAKFPEPPTVAELSGIPPELQFLDRGTELWRIYRRGGRHPTLWDVFRAFGPLASSRFDHHLPPPRIQARRVLYAALHGPTCLAEAFQVTRVIDRQAHDPWLVCFAIDRPVRLLDLTGSWPTRAGASMVLSSGPRPRAQRWSRAIYEAYPDLDGLFYPSSMLANRPAVALFERAEDAMPRHPQLHRSLSDPALLPVLKTVAMDLGYRLV